MRCLGYPILSFSSSPLILGTPYVRLARLIRIVGRLAFTLVLRDNKIQISMDGKGCWRDNVFVERLWKTIKYEEVYLRAYCSVSEARTRLTKYIDFYNWRRPHKAIGRVPPDHQYYESLPTEKAA